MDTEQQIFWTSFYTFAGGFILAVFALLYKSKCDKVNLCYGCLEIHRAVEIEIANDTRTPIKEVFTRTSYFRR